METCVVTDWLVLDGHTPVNRMGPIRAKPISSNYTKQSGSLLASYPFLSVSRRMGKMKWNGAER